MLRVKLSETLNKNIVILLLTMKVKWKVMNEWYNSGYADSNQNDKVY